MTALQFNLGVRRLTRFITVQDGRLLDEVYTTDDWYDGPLAGFASYRGRPRYYRFAKALSSDDDVFELIPVSDETLGHGIEADTIFKRWSAARHDGTVSWTYGDIVSFGALPQDRDRYAILRAILDPYAEQPYPGIHVARAEFSFDSSHVNWIDISLPPPSNER